MVLCEREVVWEECFVACVAVRCAGGWGVEGWGVCLASGAMERMAVGTCQLAVLSWDAGRGSAQHNMAVRCILSEHRLTYTCAELCSDSDVCDGVLCMCDCRRAGTWCTRRAPSWWRRMRTWSTTRCASGTSRWAGGVTAAVTAVTWRALSQPCCVTAVSRSLRCAAAVTVGTQRWQLLRSVATAAAP